MLYIGKRKGVELIETGPYSITRNPLYVFSALAALGAGAQSGSIVLAVIFAIGTVAVFYFVALREEAFLKDRFGAPFNAYCLRVPRFWPSFRLYRDEPTVFASTDRLYTTLKDGLIFFLAKPAFDFIEYLQLWGFMPILVRLI
ncbi:Phospholipid methyltransferase [Mesorhizobium sp. YR577]|nr:Phospholipid methyltransferase [Mesorhizobium sp. YR577]